MHTNHNNVPDQTVLTQGGHSQMMSVVRGEGVGQFLTIGRDLREFGIGKGESGLEIPKM